MDGQNLIGGRDVIAVFQGISEDIFSHLHENNL